MSIKDDLIKYFSQFTGDTGGFGINANPQGQLGTESPLNQLGQMSGNFGKINSQAPQVGVGGFNQLNAVQNAVTNPLSAETAINDLIAKNDKAEKTKSDFKKQIVAGSLKSMGNSGGIPAQPQLKIINAQQAFAQVPDASQPQQVQEFKPEQMAMMLRRKNGY